MKVITDLSQKYSNRLKKFKKGVELLGAAQLLEVVSAVLQGVKLPLREEHVEMVERVLVPLHRCSCSS